MHNENILQAKGCSCALVDAIPATGLGFDQQPADRWIGRSASMCIDYKHCQMWLVVELQMVLNRGNMRDSSNLQQAPLLQLPWA